MPAIDLLVRMQASRTHMALVIDEYGGTDGLISIEDLIEVVVGDIEDEHDVAEGHRVLKVEGEEAVFVADARAASPRSPRRPGSTSSPRSARSPRRSTRSAASS